MSTTRDGQDSRTARPVWGNRGLLLLVAGAGLFCALGCNGGGGGGNGASYPSVGTIDSTAALSPVPDPNYQGVPSTPLGALISNGQVTFNYWNPNATRVTVNLYTSWGDPLNSPASTVPMTLGAGGIWSSSAMPVPVPANYYVYTVDSAYVLDPYARSMAEWASNLPGDSIGKGAIIDPTTITPDGGWTDYSVSSANYFDGSAMKGPDGSASPYGYQSNRDAIVYEAGVRDLTVDPNLSFAASGHQWGTFKALVDMLPHIQKLGVTHIQLMCPLENYYYIQSLNDKREMNLSVTSGANYNWGYDPQNYFTPSGMYSAFPDDPSARVNEMMTLINEIHKQGMGVIIDVVYNHTANNNVLADPGLQYYFYRSTKDNGAGSNDVQSEAKMVRKLIVDSIMQWVGVYHADGFRFDLMGVLDTGTIQAAYLQARTLNPNVVFLGEGWQGFYSGATTDYLGNQIDSCDQLDAEVFEGKDVAMFSDSYRNLFKNGYPNDGSPAFLTGATQSGNNLFTNITGIPTNGWAPGSTNNVVSYFTCHDNLCYYDVLAMATNATPADDGTVLKRAKLGHAALMTSQGMAFFLAGDEMFRTKEVKPYSASAPSNCISNSRSQRTFCDNSYNASDAINMVAWDTVYTGGNPLAGGFTNYNVTSNGYLLYNYTQGLISLRKSSNAFRLPDLYKANVTTIPANGAGGATLAFGYKAVSSDSTGTYYVFHNADPANQQTFTVTPSLATATLLVDGNSAGLTPLDLANSTTVSVDGMTVTLQPLSSAVFKQ